MKLAIVRPESPAEKATSTTLDTMQLTQEKVARWKSPPFQRPIRINDKVRGLVSLTKANGGVLPGVITLGVVAGMPDPYVVDGQHRLEAWRLAEVKEGFADVRTIFCASMAELGNEFVKLNSKLVVLRPDDVLRGLEESSEALRLIRKKCPFVGYDMIRRGDRAPVLSMAIALRTWRGSLADCPSASGCGGATELASTCTTEEATQLSAFLNACYAAWGRDQEYAKLWGSLNLILSAWLYRRTVLSRYSPKTPVLTTAYYEKCLMSLSADKHYLDWLVGRNLGDRDRSPAYRRMKSIFAARLAQEIGKRPSMPAPAWANN